MASDRPNQTLADYVALAISPALIMALVGSLVFFLLEVLYPEKGEYKGRLQWILFFFVFGAVLVARISMTQGIAGRAGLYGLLLAGLTWLGMQIYVDYPKDGLTAAFSWLINLFLVGVVWWCAGRLTRDCTQIDEDTEVNGEGLLQATGLEKTAGEPAAAEKKAEPSGDLLIGWWERYQRFRDERKKKRVLGGWVIYFSLAALPLFGLGEALIPVEETERRQFAFWLMGAYVASGLGLLLTTCFLSLRRYLRQRRLQMPAPMTAAWLTAGGGLILALLVVGALLPRPRPEYSLISFGPTPSDQRSASDYATQNGSSGKDQGRQTGDAPKDKAAPSDKDGQARDKGNPTQDKDKGDAAGDKDKDGPAKGSEKDKESSEKDKGDPSNRDKNNDSSNPDRDKAPNPPPPKDSPPRDKTAAQQNPPKSGQTPSNTQGTSHPGSSWDWRSAVESVATVLKWIVYALLIVAVVYFVLREGLKFLANFTDWARNLLGALRSLWANLFGGRAKEANGESGADQETKRAAPLRPFASYVSPFVDGRAEDRPIKEVVRYTFDALQAWARERSVERQPGETPLEFARRLGEEFPALEAEVRRLAALYARAAYDYGPLPGASLEVLRQFWQRLQAAAEQPLSA